MSTIILFDSTTPFYEFLQLSLKDYPITVYNYQTLDDLDYVVNDITPTVVLFDTSLLGSLSKNQAIDLKTRHPMTKWVGKGPVEFPSPFQDKFGLESIFLPTPISSRDLKYNLLPFFDISRKDL